MIAAGDYLRFLAEPGAYLVIDKHVIGLVRSDGGVIDVPLDVVLGFIKSGYITAEPGPDDVTICNISDDGRRAAG